MKNLKTYLKFFNFKNTLMFIIVLFMFIYLYNHFVVIEGNRLKEENSEDDAKDDAGNKLDLIDEVIPD